MPFELAPLPYAKEALEPHIDALTMEIHHGRHHKAYVDTLNTLLADKGETPASLEAGRTRARLTTICAYTRPSSRNFGRAVAWLHRGLTACRFLMEREPLPARRILCGMAAGMWGLGFPLLCRLHQPGALLRRAYSLRAVNYSPIRRAWGCCSSRRSAT